MILIIYMMIWITYVLSFRLCTSKKRILTYMLINTVMTIVVVAFGKKSQDVALLYMFTIRQIDWFFLKIACNVRRILQNGTFMSMINLGVHFYMVYVQITILMKREMILSLECFPIQLILLGIADIIVTSV